MIIRTMLAQSSGNDSTDMHSRFGKGTIGLYREFKDLNKPLPGIKESQDEIKHNRILELMSLIPEKA